MAGIIAQEHLTTMYEVLSSLWTQSLGAATRIDYIQLRGQVCQLPVEFQYRKKKKQNKTVLKLNKNPRFKTRVVSYKHHTVAEYRGHRPLSCPGTCSTVMKRYLEQLWPVSG